MSISKTNNGGERAAPDQSPDVSVASDIEEALDFLDSEKYQDVRGSNPRQGSAAGGTESPQTLQKNDPAAPKLQHKRATAPQKAVAEPPKEVPPPLEGGKSKKSGKIWPMTLGIAALILLGIFFLYKLG